MSVSGQLFDASTEETLSFANVVAHDFKNNALLKGTITDDTARFEILDIPWQNTDCIYYLQGTKPPNICC